MSAFLRDADRRRRTLEELAAADARHRHRDHRDRRRARLATIGALTIGSLVALPATPALAHTTATSCTHSSVGVLHTQTYVIGRWESGRHVHTVQLGHPFDSTPAYDGVRHNHTTGGCAT